MAASISVRASARCLSAALILILWTGARANEPQPDFPILPPPPSIEGLIGFPQTYSKDRSAYLPLLTRLAEMAGLPPDLADAVTRVESAYDPEAVGKVGELGLMQVSPETAAMLGYRGALAGLFEPETNVRYGVAYLSRAWQLAKGDVCRTLMKYRAGWGEERMTPLSVEYCRRARKHLAAIGSPLAEGTPPPEADRAMASDVQPPVRLASLQANAAADLRLRVRVISPRPSVNRSAPPKLNLVASGRPGTLSDLGNATARQHGCQVRVHYPGQVRCYDLARR
jgi:hypothetical protein